MSNKHDVDKLFKNTFEQHVEKTDLQDWNSFVEFKDQMDKEDVTPAPIFWTTSKCVAIASIIIFIISGIFWGSQKQNTIEPVVNTIDQSITQQNLNLKPNQNVKVPPTSVISKSETQNNQKKISEIALESNTAIRENKVVENKNSFTKKITDLSSEIKKLESQKSITEIKQKNLLGEISTDLKNNSEAENSKNSILMEAPSDTDLVINKNQMDQDININIDDDYIVTTSLPSADLNLLVYDNEINNVNKIIQSDDKVQVQKNRSQLFTVGLSFELYPYESGTDKLLSYNLNLGYQKRIYPRGSLVANMSYTYRLGSYAYTQQENHVQFRYAKEQTNYAILPEGLNLLGLSLALRHDVKKGAFFVGLGSDYLLSAVGRLYSNQNNNGLQSSSDFTDLANPSALGIVDKEGLSDWQIMSFIGYEMPLNKRLAFQFRFNYIFKTLADQNEANENILIEDNRFLGEVGLNYKF
jgi:hypothetical protein